MGGLEYHQGEYASTFRYSYNWSGFYSSQSFKTKHAGISLPDARNSSSINLLHDERKREYQRGKTMYCQRWNIRCLLCTTAVDQIQWLQGVRPLPRVVEWWKRQLWFPSSLENTGPCYKKSTSYQKAVIETSHRRGAVSKKRPWSIYQGSWVVGCHYG